MNRKIGIATIHYNKKGEVTSAFFQPEIKIEADDALLDQLNTIEGEEKDIQAKATLVFSSWFMKTENFLDEVEVGDREKTYIDTTIECKKWTGTDIMQECKVKYTLKTRD